MRSSELCWVGIRPKHRTTRVGCQQEAFASKNANYVAGARRWIHIPAVPVELVDVTGAGDEFWGGALAGFAERNDPIEALLYDAVSASFCIEGLGIAGLAAATKEKLAPSCDTSPSNRISTDVRIGTDVRYS